MLRVERAHHALGRGVVAAAAHAQAVVDDDAGLGVAHHRVQLGFAPEILHDGALHPALGLHPRGVELLQVAAVRQPEVLAAVIPQDVDGAVARDQLAHLFMALRAHGKRAAAVHLRVEEALAAPVHGRIVQARPQPGRAAALHVAAHQVAPGGGVHHGEIADGMRAVEQAEAVVVAGGEHHVLHACVPGQLRKRGAVEALRGELRGKPCVVILVDGLVEHGPLAAAQHGIQAVVQEHAELQAAPLLDPRLFFHGMNASFRAGAPPPAGRARAHYLQAYRAAPNGPAGLGIYLSFAM